MVQLIDMHADIGEATNLAAKNPDRVADLRRLLDELVDNGRSTPGPRQANDTAIVIDKQPGGKKKKGQTRKSKSGK
jgi:hypothetical protein